MVTRNKKSERKRDEEERLEDPVRAQLKVREAAHRALVVGRIKELRKQQTYSQDELAAEAHLHRSHLGFIEQGRNDPTLSTLLKIADALEMSVSEMLELSQEALEDLPPRPSR